MALVGCNRDPMRPQQLLSILKLFMVKLFIKQQWLVIRSYCFQPWTTYHGYYLWVRLVLAPCWPSGRLPNMPLFFAVALKRRQLHLRMPVLDVSKVTEQAPIGHFVKAYWDGLRDDSGWLQQRFLMRPQQLLSIMKLLMIKLFIKQQGLVIRSFCFQLVNHTSGVLTFGCAE